MPNPSFRRWTADDIAKLKDLAQRHPRAEIAAKLGRSVAATSLKAHELKLSLRMRDPGDERGRPVWFERAKRARAKPLRP